MEPPVEAIAAMKTAVVRSGRKSAVQLPITFARSTGAGAPPMLAQLMAGGQGGSVRLRLFLTLAMQATSVPRTIPTRTPAAYARLLNVPGDTGPRRVSDALRWLSSHQVISRMPTAVRPGAVTLLMPDGTGGEWPRGEAKRWIGLPLQLWDDGWIFGLSTRALAAYIALKELSGGKNHPDGEFMDRIRKQQYGMSDDTWTRATVDLQNAGLLVTKTEKTGNDEAYFRFRKRYRLVHPMELEGPDWSTL